eukprot:TRINITY_DN11866_c3_g2_i1.p1 TRINITY_DN11866_c3_g2~~TRINITY_DN11866_c3_g2_i1.p1  ORF type:complete len:1308 (+),score=400.38 TRINITY_DN11866_c3_g2_i1:133-4056(+)
MADSSSPPSSPPPLADDDHGVPEMDPVPPAAEMAVESDIPAEETNSQPELPMAPSPGQTDEPSNEAAEADNDSSDDDNGDDHYIQAVDVDAVDAAPIDAPMETASAEETISHQGLELEQNDQRIMLNDTYNADMNANAIDEATVSDDGNTSGGDDSAPAAHQEQDQQAPLPSEDVLEPETAVGMPPPMDTHPDADNTSAATDTAPIAQESAADPSRSEVTYDRGDDHTSPATTLVEAMAEQSDTVPPLNNQPSYLSLGSSQGGGRRMSNASHTSYLSVTEDDESLPVTRDSSQVDIVAPAGVPPAKRTLRRSGEMDEDRHQPEPEPISPGMPPLMTSAEPGSGVLLGESSNTQTTQVEDLSQSTMEHQMYDDDDDGVDADATAERLSDGEQETAVDDDDDGMHESNDEQDPEYSGEEDDQDSDDDEVASEEEQAETSSNAGWNPFRKRQSVSEAGGGGKFKAAVAKFFGVSDDGAVQRWEEFYTGDISTDDDLDDEEDEDEMDEDDDGIDHGSDVEDDNEDNDDSDDSDDDGHNYVNDEVRKQHQHNYVNDAVAVDMRRAKRRSSASERRGSATELTSITSLVRTAIKKRGQSVKRRLSKTSSTVSRDHEDIPEAGVAAAPAPVKQESKDEWFGASTDHIVVTSFQLKNGDEAPVEHTPSPDPRHAKPAGKRQLPTVPQQTRSGQAKPAASSQQQRQPKEKSKGQEQSWFGFDPNKAVSLTALSSSQQQQQQQQQQQAPVQSKPAEQRRRAGSDLPASQAPRSHYPNKTKATANPAGRTSDPKQHRPRARSKTDGAAIRSTPPSNQPSKSKPSSNGAKPAAPRSAAAGKSSKPSAAADPRRAKAAKSRSSQDGVKEVKRHVVEKKKEKGKKTMVREQMKRIREHRPFFMYYMSFCQIAIMVIAIMVYGIAPIGFKPEITTATVDAPDGSPVEDQRIDYPNFWIGPDPKALVLMGAKYAPCMRPDDRIKQEVLQPLDQREQSLGCCVEAGSLDSTCYSTTQDDCIGFRQFFPNQVCGGAQCCDNSTGVYPNCRRINASSTTDATCQCEVVARPCCTTLAGDCEILSEQQCEFRQGVFHPDRDTCGQVNCLQDVCGLVAFANPDKPDHWYRIYLPMFLHSGALHLFFVLLFQHSVAIDVEKLAGWLRMFFIYTIAGVGGWLTSATMTPYQVGTGGSPPLYGLLGCLFVELFQSWQLLDRPRAEFVKLITIAIFALGLGVLPYLDNWSHIGGFIFGVMSSIVFLPYITFGKWDAARKRTLIFICLPGLIVLLILLVSLFFTDSLKCEWCSSLNCVNFTDTFCEDNLQDIL